MKMSKCFLWFLYLMLPGSLPLVVFAACIILLMIYNQKMVLKSFSHHKRDEG